jgi:hypothetical protein
MSLPGEISTVTSWPIGEVIVLMGNELYKIQGLTDEEGQNIK